MRVYIIVEEKIVMKEDIIVKVVYGDEGRYCS